MTAHCSLLFSFLLNKLGTALFGTQFPPHDYILTRTAVLTAYLTCTAVCNFTDNPTKTVKLVKRRHHLRCWVKALGQDRSLNQEKSLHWEQILIQSGKLSHRMWALPKSLFMWITCLFWVHFLVYRVTRYKVITDHFFKFVSETCKFHGTVCVCGGGGYSRVAMFRSHRTDWFHGSK